LGDQVLSGSIISNLLMTEFPTFDIRVEVDAHPDGSDQVVERTVVAVSGELDVATSPALEREVLALLQEGVGEVVVDASGLDFIDASGIGVLVGAANLAREAGGQLVLRGTSEATRRLLDLLELNATLPAEESPPA
jgi:anti-sigma B factor antagonist